MTEPHGVSAHGAVGVPQPPLRPPEGGRETGRAAVGGRVTAAPVAPVEQDAHAGVAMGAAATVAVAAADIDTAPSGCQYEGLAGAGAAPFVVSDAEDATPFDTAAGVPRRRRRPSAATAAPRSHVMNVLFIASAPPRAAPSVSCRGYTRGGEKSIRVWANVMRVTLATRGRRTRRATAAASPHSTREVRRECPRHRGGRL